MLQKNDQAINSSIGILCCNDDKKIPARSVILTGIWLIIWMNGFN